MLGALLVLVLLLGAAIAGVAAYQQIAIRRRIVAVPNERTLHARIVPRGAGIVIVAISLGAVVVLFSGGALPVRWFLALFGGGLAIGAVGFIDDVVDLPASIKFGVQIVVAVWATACVAVPPEIDIGFAKVNLSWFGYAATAFAVLWMINLFNFMDGIDGMASSGTLLVCVGASVILEWRGGSQLVPVLLVMGVASVGFLVFNWPPARVFLGDVGSGYYGYMVAVFILITLAADQMSFWTWLILLGYFAGDTSTTLIIRMAKVDRWYGTHRGHAYQNLARVWQNHRRMTLLAIAINVLWLLPLALASVRWPHARAPLAVLALAPAVTMAIKYGPLYDK